MRRVLILSLLALALPAGGANVSEYAVKAAYLSTFPRLVKWPRTAFEDKASPIVLGILGADPFGGTLDDEVRGKDISGRGLVVKRFPAYTKDVVDSLKACHVLFISDSEKDHVKRILSDLKGAVALTVSEIDQFPMAGGMIAFSQEGDVIGLVVNPKNARSAGLTLKAELMKDAKVYMKVDSEKVKKLYYDGITLYLNGQYPEAIRTWELCLEEDPTNAAVLKDMRKAKSKLRALSRIR